MWMWMNICTYNVCNTHSRSRGNSLSGIGYGVGLGCGARVLLAKTKKTYTSRSMLCSMHYGALEHMYKQRTDEIHSNELSSTYTYYSDSEFECECECRCIQ
jgi:hypothetical protein